MPGIKRYRDLRASRPSRMTDVRERDDPAGHPNRVKSAEG